MFSDEKFEGDCCLKKKLITVGKCSKFNLYILYSALFKFLSLIILGDKGKNIGLCGFSPILYSYNSMQSLYTYFGYIVIGIICRYAFENRKKEIKISQGSFLYNNPEFSKNTLKTKLYILLICFCYIFYLETENILYSKGLHLLNYWTFETIFLILLMKKYFNFHMYRHRKCSLIFIISGCSACLLVASFLPNSSTDDNSLNSYQIVNKQYGSYLYCLLFILFFIFLSFTYSFSRTLLKVLMQAKFVSVNIFIISIGVTGIVLGLVYAFVLYYLKSEYNIIDYFNEFKNSERDYKFYLEIFLVNPLFIFTKYMQIYFEIQTIYYLNPIYGLLINNLCFGIQKFIAFIISNFTNVLNFIFNELSELLGIIGYIFYLEILELNFCGLSDNTKRRITIKGENEFNNISISMDELMKDDEDNDEYLEMAVKKDDEEENND